MLLSFVLFVRCGTAERIRDQACSPQFLFDGIVGALDASAELIGPLEVQRQLFFQMRHAPRWSSA